MLAGAFRQCTLGGGKILSDADNRIANEVFDIQSIVDHTRGELAERNEAVASLVDLIIGAMDHQLSASGNVAAELVEYGLWLSLIGSTEGAPHDEGPPRRSARDVMNAIEPALEIVQLRSTEFTVCEEQLKSWLCLSRTRDCRAALNSSLNV